MKKENNLKILENLALVSQIGISMAVPIVGGIFLGNYLDEKIGTKMIFFVVFLILGVIVSFINLFKLATRGINRK